jgi:hypothetical protein
MLGRVNFEQFLNKNRMLFSECCFLRYLQNNDYDLKKKNDYIVRIQLKKNKQVTENYYFYILTNVFI